MCMENIIVSHAHYMIFTTRTYQENLLHPQTCVVKSIRHPCRRGPYLHCRVSSESTSFVVHAHTYLTTAGFMSTLAYGATGKIIIVIHMVVVANGKSTLLFQFDNSIGEADLPAVA